ncbi:hypothetical protein D3C84_948400 [compost metagenome]
MEVESAAVPAAVHLQCAAAAGSAVAGGDEGDHALGGDIEDDLERGAQRHVGQQGDAGRGSLVVALAKAVGELALVPEHLDRRAVVVLDVQLGDHHLLRRVDLAQGHGLVVVVFGGAAE